MARLRKRIPNRGPNVKKWWLSCALIASLGLGLALPAHAQFSDSYNFLKAVRDRDGQKATDLLQKPGSTVVNSRDVSTGENALHVVVERRDTTWLSFLLGNGANPNLTDNARTTPLMLATQLR